MKCLIFVYEIKLRLNWESKLGEQVFIDSFENQIKTFFKASEFILDYLNTELLITDLQCFSIQKAESKLT